MAKLRSSPRVPEQPFIYRGFQMIDEELRDLRGDELRKMAQNGCFR
jgi:hypothetical protein